MPPRGLPGNANLEQLRNGAKSFQRAVRAGDPGAARIVNEFHPRLGAAAPGSAELAGFTRADAQLVVARQFGFPSWPRLKAHLELVARYVRSPHHAHAAASACDDGAPVDAFLRLACLTYGDDDPDRFRQATALLFAHEGLACASIHTIAVTGEVEAARARLADDPSQASLVGGPFAWEPLLYLTYSRVPLCSGCSSVGVARLLLEQGADPNAGYLWEGLLPPFTALTGALGGGGRLPKHPEGLALARLLLEFGADPNDAQAIYNEGGDESADEEWLELLFAFGLGRGDGGPWRRRFGDRQDSPTKMLEDLLIAAATRGHTERVRRLLARGVDPDGARITHPIYGGRSPVQQAALNGHMDIVALLVDAGATWEHDAVDALIAAAMAGDRPAVERLLAAKPGCRERALERYPVQLVHAAEQNRRDAVAQLLALGFDPNARSQTTPLHEAAMRGNLAVIDLLLAHGADPTVPDRAHHATPAGWAEHHDQPEAQRVLAEAAAEAATTRDRASAGMASADPSGAAMRTVTVAFTAAAAGRFDELGGLLAEAIDWRGLPDGQGAIPRCAGRDASLERIRTGLLARRDVSVRAFVEVGDRVLAHVRRVRDDESGPPERFLVAEVRDGQITHLHAYVTQAEAEAALHAGEPADAKSDPAARPAPATMADPK